MIERRLKTRCAGGFWLLSGVVWMIASGVTAPARASPAPAIRPAAYDQRQVDREAERCKDRAAGDPTEIQACDGRAFTAALKAVSKSPANAQFQAFIQALSDPLVFKLTGGEDALSQEVVVSAALSKLAGRRALVLTGQDLQFQPPKGKPTIAGSFSWLSDHEDAVQFEGRWARIKAADCAAYAAPNCQQRLEQALRQTLAEVLADARK